MFSGFIKFAKNHFFKLMTLILAENDPLTVKVALLKKIL